MACGDSTVSSCLIMDNSAHEGGGISISQGVTVANCTVALNSAETGGGIYCSRQGQSSGHPQITGSILWKNSASEGAQIALTDGSKCAVSYCSIHHGSARIYVSKYSSLQWGPWNITGDPCFVDERAGNYHLREDSPCVNAADPNTHVETDEPDMDGDPRRIGGRVDIGADEVPLAMPFMDIWPPALSFLATEAGVSPQAQILELRNAGPDAMDWTIASSCDWLDISPRTGRSSGETETVAISVDIANLNGGTHSCNLTISSDAAGNAPRRIPVQLHLYGRLSVPSEYPTIQAAIDDANDGDTVIVEDGVYSGDGNKYIDAGPQCYDYQSWPEKRIVVKSANGPANCILDGQGTGSAFAIDGMAYCHRVPIVLIEGFTIRNFSTGITFHQPGLYPAVKNCVITGNTMGINCMEACYMDITDCTITDSSWVGVYCNMYAQPNITRCTISNNAQGGLYCETAAGPILNDCIISGNTALQGGAVYLRDYCNPQIRDCFITGNRADSGGAFYLRDNSQLLLANCTIADNSAGIGGALTCIESSTTTITNSILWDNAPSCDAAIYDGDTAPDKGTVLFDFSLIQCPDIHDSNNLSTDPCFVSPGHWDPNTNTNDPNDDFFVDGDYHLRWNSPAINAGDPCSLPDANDLDIDGEPRIMANRIDIGADEVGPKQADLTRDGSIDLRDIAVILQAWTTRPTDPQWRTLCDLSNDQHISFPDLTALLESWLWTAPWQN